ncbi:MAG: ribonuclease H [Parcubacteria group bacterium]|nr:MAG: ribonuclease H [Parcubacteria group bacterium]
MNSKISGGARYRLFSDGGARGNPGPAAIGAVLYNGTKTIGTVSEYIGETTNNQAEYKAVIAGLKLALENKITELHCFLDSELVVEQLNRNYKVKDKELAKLFVQVWNLSQSFKKVTFQHVRREQNKFADKLVNQALDKIIG